MKITDTDTQAEAHKSSQRRKRSTTSYGVLRRRRRRRSLASVVFLLHFRHFSLCFIFPLFSLFLFGFLFFGSWDVGVVVVVAINDSRLIYLSHNTLIS